MASWKQVTIYTNEVACWQGKVYQDSPEAVSD